MKITQIRKYFCIILLGLSFCKEIAGFSRRQAAKKNKCLNPPRTARRVETVINECQEEVRNKLVNEAYRILKAEVAQEQMPQLASTDIVELIQYTEQPPRRPPRNGDAIANGDAEVNDVLKYVAIDSLTSTKRMSRLAHEMRRIDQMSSTIYHPTLVPMEDKRIAGCLLHCVYAKNNAIDKNGWPTLDGLVDFYSEGVNEHGFFMATLRSVNVCLRAVTNLYHVTRMRLPEKGESCDLAFDVFDCISDQITGYCLDQYSN